MEFEEFRLREFREFKEFKEFRTLPDILAFSQPGRTRRLQTYVLNSLNSLIQNSLNSLNSLIQNSLLY